jgi:hypothetical protein
VPAGHRQRAGQQRVRKRQRDRGVADVTQPGDGAGPHHPAPGHGQQRAGQQHEPERKQADPAGAADGEADMVCHQPEHGGGAQHPAKTGADADVRRGDPADRGQRDQHSQPARGGRERGDAARDEQRPGRLLPRLAAVTAIGRRRFRRPFRVRGQRHLGGNTHPPILATIGSQPPEARRREGNAVKPRIQRVQTHWNPGFIASGGTSLA